MTGNLYVTVFPPPFTTAKYFPTEGNASNFLSNEMHRYFKTRETIHHLGHINYPRSAKKVSRVKKFTSYTLLHIRIINNFEKIMSGGFNLVAITRFGREKYL